MTSPADPARFRVCLPFTLAQECPLPSDWSNPRNFSNSAHDPGGATMCGITQREYDAWRKARAEPVHSVKLITQAEGEAIYSGSYWLPHCPDLPGGLDLSFFDASVNEGTEEAIKMLQVALDIPSDGTWGPQTTLALKGHDPVATIKAFTARREAVYREFAGYPYFGTDWERRAAEIGASSLKMAGVTP